LASPSIQYADKVGLDFDFGLLDNRFDQGVAVRHFDGALANRGC
jgi:hypothetical protein